MTASTARTELSPRPPDLPGIVLAVPAKEEGPTSATLHGAFRVRNDMADLLEGPAHRAIALVINGAGFYASGMPFRDHVLFEDDVDRDNATQVGYFSIDMQAHAPPAAGGHLHVLVSLDEFVSNVVELELPRD